MSSQRSNARGIAHSVSDRRLAEKRRQAGPKSQATQICSAHLYDHQSIGSSPPKNPIQQAAQQPKECIRGCRKAPLLIESQGRLRSEGISTNCALTGPVTNTESVGLCLSANTIGS